MVFGNRMARRVDGRVVLEERNVEASLFGRFVRHELGLQFLENAIALGFVADVGQQPGVQLTLRLMADAQGFENIHAAMLPTAA
jgi:hypothetical protein